MICPSGEILCKTSAMLLISKHCLKEQMTTHKNWTPISTTVSTFYEQALNYVFDFYTHNPKIESRKIGMIKTSKNPFAGGNFHNFLEQSRPFFSSKMENGAHQLYLSLVKLDLFECNFLSKSGHNSQSAFFSCTNP